MMHSCAICLDFIKSPVALPCGHVFCHECILGMVGLIIPFTTTHSCPSCRSSYSIVNIDPSIVPAYLRSSLLPSIRRLYLDDSITIPDDQVRRELARLRVENASLKTECERWGTRCDDLHTSMVGLAGLFRMAGEDVLRIKAEKDEIEKKYCRLQRRCGLEEVVASDSSVHICNQASVTTDNSTNPCSLQDTSNPSSSTPSPSPTETLERDESTPVSSSHCGRRFNVRPNTALGHAARTE